MFPSWLESARLPFDIDWPFRRQKENICATSFSSFSAVFRQRNVAAGRKSISEGNRKMRREKKNVNLSHSQRECWNAYVFGTRPPTGSKYIALETQIQCQKRNPVDFRASINYAVITEAEVKKKEESFYVPFLGRN